MTAIWKGRRVILSYREGGRIYVTEDGFAFTYGYETAAPCDMSQLKEGSPEWYECLHHDSKLVAKLEPSLLRALKLDLALVAESERVELPCRSIGDSLLEVPGRGHKGSPLEIAWCRGGGASQLSSPEATRVFDVFRRLRRAVVPVGRIPSAWGQGKDEKPGVLAWWSYED